MNLSEDLSVDKKLYSGVYEEKYYIFFRGINLPNAV